MTQHDIYRGYPPGYKPPRRWPQRLRANFGNTWLYKRYISWVYKNQGRMFQEFPTPAELDDADWEWAKGWQHTIGE